MALFFQFSQKRDVIEQFNLRIGFQQQKIYKKSPCLTCGLKSVLENDISDIHGIACALGSIRSKR